VTPLWPARILSIGTLAAARQQRPSLFSSSTPTVLTKGMKPGQNGVALRTLRLPWYLDQLGKLASSRQSSLRSIGRMILCWPPVSYMHYCQLLITIVRPPLQLNCRRGKRWKVQIICPRTNWKHRTSEQFYFFRRPSGMKGL
jgi:hypothetical protein